MLYNGVQPPDDITLQRPGALYKARWMSKIIYTFKIVLLSKQQLYWSIIASSGLVKPKRFVDFCIHRYISWCINCIVALADPGNVKVCYTRFKFTKVLIESDPKR